MIDLEPLRVLHLLVIVAAVWGAFLPVPVGFDRGKVVWNTWCWTGMHVHRTYWHGRERGFQTAHPNEVSDR